MTQIASLHSARILGIESSCDETAAAVVENGRLILANLVASQADLHAQFGGVFPEVASRQHILTIYPILQAVLKEAHLELANIDAIAVTRGPGLPGSLVVGMNSAKGLVLSSGKPFLGINHLEAHIYSAWLDWPPLRPGETRPPKPAPQFPLVALIVSGGHTELVLMRDHLKYERLGATLDDAAGEAFDKVARLLGLSYPGGPAIQNTAVTGNPNAFHFPRSWLDNSFNFSFSGLKTAVLREVRRLESGLKEADVENNTVGVEYNALPIPDLAASFQAAVVDVLVGKSLRAARDFEAKEILVVGGVSANKSLREAFLAQSEFPVQIPPLALCTDNAAMVAAAGYFRFAAGQRDTLGIDVLPTWPLSEL